MQEDAVRSLARVFAPGNPDEKRNYAKRGEDAEDGKRPGRNGSRTRYIGAHSSASKEGPEVIDGVPAVLRRDLRVAGHERLSEQVSRGWFASMKEQPAVQALEAEPLRGSESP